MDILESVLYALIFLGISLPILGLGYWVLDVITPGHKLGERLLGSSDTTPVVKQGVAVPAPVTPPSFSAAVVTSAWMIAQAFIVFTSVWTNAHGNDLGSAIGWTIVFSLVGLALQTVAFLALDAVIPGKLSDEICSPGPVRPIAWVAAANVVAVGVIVIAVIS